jgi:hypothetical protein
MARAPLGIAAITCPNVALREKEHPIWWELSQNWQEFGAGGVISHRLHPGSRRILRGDTSSRCRLGR